MLAPCSDRWEQKSLFQCYTKKEETLQTNRKQTFGRLSAGSTHFSGTITTHSNGQSFPIF